MFALVKGLEWLGWLVFPDGNLSTRLTLYSVLILTVLFFQVSRAFLQTLNKSWLWWLLGAAWLAIFALFETNWIGLPLGAGAFLRQGLAIAILLLGWAVFMAQIILLTAHAYRWAQHPYARSRSRLWTWPVLFSLAGDLAIFAWAIWLSGSQPLALIAWVEPAGGADAAQPFFAAAVRAFTLANIFLVFGFGLRLTGACLSIGIVVSQLLPRARYNTQRALREYSLSISNILDSDLLATVAIGLINEAFEIRRGHLFLVEYEKADNLYCLRIAKGMGENVPAPGKLSASSPVIEFFIHQRRVLSQYALDRLAEFKTIPVEERVWLKGLEADIYVPIYAKEEWVGLLVLGPKVSGAPYGEDELEFLGILADQTAVALHNARLVESLTRLNNEFRRAYTALERANHQLERLDRTKSDFISVASHELRTPLSVIQGYSEILSEESPIRDNPYYAKMVSGIRTGIQRLHEIVESMLDMASIDTRTFQLSTEPVSIHVLVRMILEGIKKADFDRKLDIQIADMRDLPALTADPEALRKVFTHLIFNAIKFTPDGGKIGISGRVLPPGDGLPDGGLEILVSDTGIGIAPEVQDLVFNKFYQTGKVNLHSTGKTKFKGGGQGLGLAIAKGIIDAHGGKIWVESPGYNEETCPGSKFYVVLPLKC
jgi:signal transduction histidine kinase